jgi:hypothetical protein
MGHTHTHTQEDDLISLFSFFQDKESRLKNSFRTSQAKHHVSATITNRLMLFREIIAVYCENHMEHKNNL